MDRFSYMLLFFRPVELGYNDSRAGRHSDEEANQQVDQCSRRTAYRGKCLFSHKLSNDHGICRVVKLLEKCPEQDRKEKEQELLPDHAVRDPVVACRMILLKCHIFTLYKIRHAWIPFAVFSECMAIDTSALYLSAADTGRRYD